MNIILKKKSCPIYTGTSFLGLYSVKVFVTILFLLITYLRVTVFNLFKDFSQVLMRLTWLLHNKLQEEQGASSTWRVRRGDGNAKGPETP